MATSILTKPAAKGGSFLLESPAPQDIFTPADLTDDQKLIGQTAEEFVTKEVFPLVKDLEAKKPGLMAELVRKGAELGLMSGGTPEEYGGAGLDKVATTVLTEKLSMYGGFAVTHGAHAGIGTLPIVYFGTEAQKKKYLPKLASGELIGAYCLSEPQAGSDAQNSLTRAELNKEGTHYILNGQKTWRRSSPGANREMKSTRWEFMAVRPRRSSWKTARCPRKTCCMKSAVGTSWRSTC